MKADVDGSSVRDMLDLKSKQMLVVNPEYQRGAVWSISQKKRLIDSVLRGYPIPLIYLHHIRQEAGNLVSERYEVIDGQQRINALFEFREGAFKLFDPNMDGAAARFPDFIKRQPCPWGRKAFNELSADLQEMFLATALRIVRIETHDPNEARDLFVRLQAGLPLTSQEKRNSWPGQFTDFVLRLAGKPGLTRYPGDDFFNILMRAQKVQDRGRFRQLAAQISMLYFTRHSEGRFCDINAEAIDDFYYENLGFNSRSADARRLVGILQTIFRLLGDKKRPKIIGHEAIHLMLLVDTLLDDYVPTWEGKFAAAFDEFRSQFALAKLIEDKNASDYWLRYGLLTRANSDRGNSIRKRHEFFAMKMGGMLDLKVRDSTRAFGPLERELIYYRDKKLCAVCGTEVAWPDLEIHHIQEHSKGGLTDLANGVAVHAAHHPKGQDAIEFAKQWATRQAPIPADDLNAPADAWSDLAPDDEDT